MPNQLIREFDASLDRLFDRRTHWVKSLIRERSPGASPQINRKNVQKEIGNLQYLAVEALLTSNLLRPLPDFFDMKRRWHPKKGKGFGVYAKKKSFENWYDKHITYKNCVYVFWNGHRCLYIGRTLNGKGRPSSHFTKFWFGKATRVDIYGSKAKKRIPAFECRLTHTHEPSHSRMKPAKAKFFWRCEICETEKKIKDEIKTIFRLK